MSSNTSSPNPAGNTGAVTRGTAPTGPARGSKMIRAIPLAFFREGFGMTASGRPRTMAGAVIAADEAGTGPIRVGVIVGRATAYKIKPKMDANGEMRESVLLLGSFEGERFADGEKIRAPGVYLPSLFTEGAVAQLQGGIAALEFAIEIGAERDSRPNAPIAYTWTVNNLLQDVVESPLERIKRRMVEHDYVKPLPLPAPTPAGQPAPASAAPDVILAGAPAEEGEEAEQGHDAHGGSLDMPDDGLPARTAPVGKGKQAPNRRKAAAA